MATSSKSDTARQTEMDGVNPSFILRNYLLEIAIRAANDGDFSEVDKLLKQSEKPYDQQIAQNLTCKPPKWGYELCVSCSS